MIDVFLRMQQQRGIASAQNTATQAKSDLERANHTIHKLEDSVQEFGLITQALCELVQTRLGITDAEVLARMEEIKHKAVNKAQKAQTAHASPCPKCARPLGAKVTRCLYCGTAVTKTEIFG